MKINPIKCVAKKVDTDTKICIGLAKTEEGEEFIIGGRTPSPKGMCSNAFCALSNAAFIMMSTENKLAKKNESIDRMCPHGVVTFNLSRVEQEDK